MSGECEICGEHALECKCMENEDKKTIEFISAIVKFVKTHKISDWDILLNIMSAFCYFCERIELPQEDFNEILDATKETYSRVNNGESKKIFK